jgi:hypothetical protein
MQGLALNDLAQHPAQSALFDEAEQLAPAEVDLQAAAAFPEGHCHLVHAVAQKPEVGVDAGSLSLVS